MFIKSEYYDDFKMIDMVLILCYTLNLKSIKFNPIQKIVKTEILNLNLYSGKTKSHLPYTWLKLTPYY